MGNKGNSSCIQFVMPQKEILKDEIRNHVNRHYADLISEQCVTV